MAGVLAVSDDLLFIARVQETARQLGVPLGRVGWRGDVAARTRELAPGLILFDLAGEEAGALEVIRTLAETAGGRAAARVGIAPHVRRELRGAAIVAGCDRVLPRAVLAGGLADLLRPYAAGE